MVEVPAEPQTPTEKVSFHLLLIHSSLPQVTAILDQQILTSSQEAQMKRHSVNSSFQLICKGLSVSVLMFLFLPTVQKHTQ